ncbi:MAG: FIG004556: membrane metalloprotease, partial [uncultured Rubrobacteraceae bacterium]
VSRPLPEQPIRRHRVPSRARDRHNRPRGRPRDLRLLARRRHRLPRRQGDAQPRLPPGRARQPDASDGRLRVGQADARNALQAARRRLRPRGRRARRSRLEPLYRGRLRRPLPDTHLPEWLPGPHRLDDGVHQRPALRLQPHPHPPARRLQDPLPFPPARLERLRELHEPVRADDPVRPDSGGDFYSQLLDLRLLADPHRAATHRLRPAASLLLL